MKLTGTNCSIGLNSYHVMVLCPRIYISLHRSRVAVNALLMQLDFRISSNIYYICQGMGFDDSVVIARVKHAIPSRTGL